MKPLSRLSLIESVTRQLCAARYRSLPRVDLEIPVRLTAPTREELGVVRNVSRGGAFVETACELPRHAEVDLRFRLPGTPHLLAASARVIWRKPDAAGAGTAGTPRHGFGLRFLDIDRAGIRSLEDFVYERAAPSRTPAPPVSS